MIVAAQNSPTALFEAHRKYLVALAYRMLGSLSDAEDIVQEAWIRWQKTDPARTASPRAYLRTIATRLCLDHLKSARVRREEYVGSWLPEPVTPDQVDFTVGTISQGDLTMSLLLALERLSPEQRAAFLLHDVFDIPFAEIAVILEKSDAGCRQLASRARKEIRKSGKRFTADRAEAEKLTEAFIAAVEKGDAESFKQILADDVLLHSDGGGVRLAAINVIEGMDRVTRFFLGVARRARGNPAKVVYRGPINASPGYISMEADGLPQATIVDIGDGKIEAIYLVRNPEKLRSIGSEATPL